MITSVMILSWCIIPLYARIGLNWEELPGPSDLEKKIFLNKSKPFYDSLDWNSMSRDVASKRFCQAISIYSVASVQYLLAEREMNVLVRDFDVQYPFDRYTNPLSCLFVPFREPMLKTKLIAILRTRAKDVRYLSAMGNTSMSDTKLKAQTAMQKDSIDSLSLSAAKVARWLIRAGSSLNTTVDLEHNTPLHIASYQALSGVVHVLIEHGADVNARNKDGRTPLHFAVLHGNIKIAKLLIEAGSNLEVADIAGTRPIDIISSVGPISFADAAELGVAQATVRQIDRRQNISGWDDEGWSHQRLEGYAILLG